jgi:hypothetical protein
MHKVVTFLFLAAVHVASPGAAQESASARLAAPGPEHAWLEPLVGTWDVQMRVFPAAGAEPIAAEGPLRAERVWTLDGRYLREELRGTVFGRAAARDAIMGYNRLDRRVELVTVDTFEPGQMIYVGRGDEGPGGFSLYGESVEAGLGADPTGRMRHLRFEWKLVSKDENIQRIFVTYPGESEFLFVEQHFTRAD